MSGKVHGIFQGLLVGQIFIGIISLQSKPGFVVDLKRKTGAVEAVFPDNGNAIILLCEQQGCKLDQFALWAKVGFRLGISNACLALIKEEYGAAWLVEGVIDPEAVQKGTAVESQYSILFSCNRIMLFFEIIFLINT